MLQTRIQEKLVENRWSANQLAQATNITPSNLSKFLNRKAEMNFISALSLVRGLFPKEEKPLMSDYVAKCKRPENIRLALEYCSRHRMVMELEALIERAKTSPNLQTREFGSAYVLVLNRLRGTYASTIFEDITSFKSSFSECAVLLRILLSYYFHDNRKFDMLFESIKGLHEEIESLPSAFIRASFSSRMHELFANASLFSYQLEEARHHCHEILLSPLSGGKIIANAYHILGMSYLYEDSATCLLYLQKAIASFQSCGLSRDAEQVEAHSLSFVRNVHSISATVPKDPEEKAHYFIRKGAFDKALSILSKLPETPFIYYYKGLCLSEQEGVDFLYRSMVSFERDGDFFYSKLPKRELIKRGQEWAVH